MSREFLGDVLTPLTWSRGWLSSSHVPFSKLLFISHGLSVWWICPRSLFWLTLRPAGLEFAKFRKPCWESSGLFPVDPGWLHLRIYRTPTRVWLHPTIWKAALCIPQQTPNPALPPPSPLSCLCNFQKLLLCPREWSWIGDPLRGRSRVLYPVPSPVWKYPLEETFWGKNGGKKFRGAFGLLLGLGFFFFPSQCSRVKEGTLWELSPPWGMQWQILTPAVNKALPCAMVWVQLSGLKTGLCLCVFIFQLDYWGVWHHSHTNGWCRRKSSNQLSLEPSV